MNSLLAADYQHRCTGGSDIVGHLPYLHDRAATGAATVLELGVRAGESTCAFLAALEAHGGHLWSVDVARPRVPDSWHDLERWTFFLGDDLDPFIAAQIPPQLDVLFIDTDHRYQHTMDELDLYGHRVRPGGVILLHDTDLEVAPGSTEEADRDYPVRRAVQDWCQKGTLTPEFRDGWHGLGVIEVT